ncbi:MAG: prepilin-type N-terminal cleavage/methylation domain-containing protein [Candidatus Woykebacteria bacterium]
MMFNRKSYGFTLIELLIVIVIIAVLVTITASSYREAQESSRDSKRKSDLAKLEAALERFYSDNNKYPNDNGVGGLIVCPDGTALTWGEDHAFQCTIGGSDKVYMNEMPKDPRDSRGYFYNATDINNNPCDNNDTNSGNDCFKYIISAQIEDAQDKDVINLTGCSPQTGATPTYNYCVPRGQRKQV